MLNIVLNSHASAQLLTPWKKYPKTQILDCGNGRFVYANGLLLKRVFSNGLLFEKDKSCVLDA